MASRTIGGGEQVNIEFVSTNPTGRCMSATAGARWSATPWPPPRQGRFAVRREYYINDAGAQVDALARSVHLRYREALGDAIGRSPMALSRRVSDRHRPGACRTRREKWLGRPEAEWLRPVGEFAVAAMMRLIRGISRRSASGLTLTCRSASCSSAARSTNASPSSIGAGLSMSVFWRRPKASCPRIGSRDR